MDWQMTCRVCLESGDMVSLFDLDENNVLLGDKYTYCCGIKVAKNDTLPTLICLTCVDKLTYAYHFKQQCLSSNDTLKECLDEFKKTSATLSERKKKDQDTPKSKDTETITIKQENGVLLQYELPIEHDPILQWSNTGPGCTVVTKAPSPKKRGRPRKYPNQNGSIELSPYMKKKTKPQQKEPEALTTLLATGSLNFKEEPVEELDENELLDDNFINDEDQDPDFNPSGGDDSDDGVKNTETVRKRGRPRKKRSDVSIKEEMNNSGEDMLLKETIMANSEPIPEHILNPKPKVKKKYNSATKKKYSYSKTFTCETCGSSFTSNSSLQAHIRRHLGIKPFVCGVCGFASVSGVDLKRHMVRHTDHRPFPCRHCDRRFYEFGDRLKHESVCGYACVLNEALRRHMLRHTGERPYKCRICDRRFGDYGTRQKHERLHMGVRPYQCSLCGKAFTYSYVLSNHMLTHTGEKKYSCAPCDKKFTKAHHLTYHNKVHHKELYLKQQLENESKKMRQQIDVSGLTGVITGKIVDGTLQLVHDAGEDKSPMQVVEECLEDMDQMVMEGDIDEKETDRAVAEMQAVELVDDTDYCIQEDDEEEEEEVADPDEENE